MAKRNNNRNSAGSSKKNDVFKVAETKGSKRPKEVRIKLKRVKENVLNKQSKIDSALKTLHTDMVVKPKKADNSATSKQGSSSGIRTRSNSKVEIPDVKKVVNTIKKMAV